ncbi:phosphotransferase family protein [Parafrankia sp. EUN1f]|uniref:phosphotransferase family protein n=1 Tax=Parafrankia sp. EUN1f TaxID=102897 RepID=UPI0001C44224|nr:phosphotransferase family protein [Parafrankia sp. EUN1f]EFC85780.1 aminoglycoside phosphotransferase [Parafrankia sp. EUN1f]
MIYSPPRVVVAKLTSWLNLQGVGSGPVSGLTVLAGGTQNLLVRFSRDGHDYVLRMPPGHPRPNSDATMVREASILAGLTGSVVPHPRLVALCEDLDVFGCCFFVMEAVDGYNAMSEVPQRFREDPELQLRMGLSFVDALAALGRVDPVAAGIAHLGRAEGWLERQVARWRRQLDSYGEFDAWPGPDQLGDVTALGRWLEERVPRRWRPGVIHGDFHLGNVLFSRSAPEVAAVLDWELATIGDPLLDLGHLLATWPGPGGPGRIPPAAPLPGLPGPAAILERYATGTDRDLSEISWYQALACYRLAILLEGSHARAAAGRAPADIGAKLHTAAVTLVEQGLRLATGETAAPLPSSDDARGTLRTL